MIVTIINANFALNEEEALLEEEILLEEVEKLSQPHIICFYGKDIFFDRLRSVSRDIDVIHLGYSPIADQKLMDFLSIILVIKGVHEPVKVNYLNYESEVDWSQNAIYLALSGYLNRVKDINGFLHSVRFLKNKVSFDVFFKPNTFVNYILGYLEYDSLILSLYTSEFSECPYGLQSRDYYPSLKNKTIFMELAKIANINYNKNMCWSSLKNVTDNYIRYSSTKNEKASILYVALLIRISTFYKKNNQAIIAYTTLLRSVEISLIFFLLKKRSINATSSGLYFTDGVRAEGVATLMKRVEIITGFNMTKITRLNNIRNNCILGHGFNFPQLMTDYDDCRTDVNQLIKKLISEQSDVDFYNNCIKVFSFSQDNINLFEDKYNELLLNPTGL